ncbi:MAG: ECF transporter S component [Anaerolineae bacterium]|nr:ECF transporter S component [Anaerolineae bacterium]
MTKLTTRDLTTIAIFGAIWGALEITLGSYLHVIFPPLTTPLVGTGTIMTGIGMIIALMGYLFVPKTGAVLMIGVVTAILKALSIGGVKLSPMLAIIIECLLAEAGLVLARKPSRWGFVLAGALAVLWTFFHKFFGSYVFLGRAITEVYLGMLKQGSQALGIDVSLALVIIAAFLLIRIAVGAVAGWLAWELGGAVRGRLAR